MIAPWNFPVAIPLGMVAAGLPPATPSCSSPPSRRPAARYMLVRALREAGVPPARSRCSPARAPSAPLWSRDPRVHTIAFTGSGAVGLEIVREAAEMPPRASGTSST